MFTLNQQISSIRNDLNNLKININSNTTDYSGGIMEYTIFTMTTLDDIIEQLDNVTDTISGENLRINETITSLSGSIDTINYNLNNNTYSTTISGDISLNSLTTQGDLTICGTIINTELENTLGGKQDILTAGDNITIIDNIISSTGGGTTIDSTSDISCNSIETTSLEVLNAPVLVTDHAVRIKSQVIVKGETFDTILLRRISGDGTMNLKEVQLWINDINVFVTNTIVPSNNQAGGQLGNTVEFVIPNATGIFTTTTALSSNIASNAVNNYIPVDMDTHTASGNNASLYIPLNSTFNVADIQSFVFYNRVGAPSFRAKGLQLQIYNRSEDRSLSNPIVVSNIIEETQLVYRFDFPQISSYTNFITGDSTQFITSDALISTDITFADGQEPEVAVALKLEDGRLESNQEISAKNVVVTNTSPTLDTELTSKLYVDTIFSALHPQITNESDLSMSNLHVTGDLFVDGSFNINNIIQNDITINNEILISTQLDISNQGTGPALKVTQLGSGNNEHVALFNAGEEGDSLLIDSSGNTTIYKQLKVIGDVSMNNVRIQTLDVSNLNIDNGTLAIDTISGLSTALSELQPTINANDLSISDVSGLRVELDGLQSTINANDLSISDVSGLLTILSGKQDNITETTDLSFNSINASTINASNIVGYQQTLIAGDNISIMGNTISATGGGGTAETLGEQVFYAVSSVDVLIGNVTVYLSTFNTIPKTNTDLYTFTNNNTITILKSGFYKINFQCNFENFGFNERTTIRTSVMLNGVSDITSGGQATCYIRNNTVGPNGTTNGALFYELTAGDFIQLQNGINQQADIDYDTNFNSDYNFLQGSNIMITRMDINAVTADGTFLQGKLTAGTGISLDGDVISATGGGGSSMGESSTGIVTIAIAKINTDGTNIKVIGCSVTRTNVGRYSLTFDTAQPTSDYVPQLTVAEPTATQDDALITFDNGTASTTGFSYSVTEQDNGTNPGAYIDRAHFVTVSSAGSFIDGFTDITPLQNQVDTNTSNISTLLSGGGGGTLPADANFSSVTADTANITTINVSTINASGNVEIDGDVEIYGRLNAENEKMFIDNQVIDLDGLTSYNLSPNQEWLTSNFITHNNGLFTFQNLPETSLFIVTVLIGVESDVYNDRVNWRLTPFLDNSNFNGYGQFYTYTRGASLVARYSTLMVRTLVGANNGQVYRLTVDCNKEGDNTFGSSMNGLRIRNATIMTFQYVGPFSGQQF